MGYYKWWSFAPVSSQDYTAQFNAGTIAEKNVGFISKSFESNLVTDFDFNNWTTDNNLGDWVETDNGSVKKVSLTTADQVHQTILHIFFKQENHYHKP